MNCFQNVSLAYRLQSSTFAAAITKGCELLSKCIFGISFTIRAVGKNRQRPLWIAFKMYLWHIVYNFPSFLKGSCTVVNCFQNVSLAYRLQFEKFNFVPFDCCELLSKCIFGISFTIERITTDSDTMLWIAFKMYLWHIVYNKIWKI